MIPKIIHYVWCGSKFPAGYKGYVESWREFNPDWQFVLWNEDNIDFNTPTVGELYRNKKFNKVSDVIRHKAVLEQGGIYLDTDFLVFRPLDRLLQYKCFYGFQHKKHDTDLIAPGAFGAEPGHWFVRKVYERMLTTRNSVMGVDIPTAIGPKLVTSMLREEGLNSYADDGVYVKDVFCCPVHWFYPFAYGEEFTQECVRDDTLMAHFWERSWEKYTSPATKVLRSMRQLVRKVRV
jgi:mannosyltransferase OCH1-like enzyme